MIVIVCPGQGSQTPGFLAEWLDLPGAQSMLDDASQHAGVDLMTHGTRSDADTIRDTRIAQPLIVAASLLAWQQLAARSSLDDAGVAGHSVGEFAAAAIAGVLTGEEAVSLVGVRGRAMADAAAAADTGMSAILGGDEDAVLAKIEEHGLTAANRNGGGQIVAAGPRSALAALADDAPRGTRVVPLSVAGAFHTSAMSAALPVLASAAAAVRPNDPIRPLWTNADGSRVDSGARFVDLLVQQVARPVRWDSCMESFTEAGITGLIELTPAGALTGIAKRGLRGVPTVAVKTPADLDAAAELIERSSAASASKGSV